MKKNFWVSLCSARHRTFILTATIAFSTILGVIHLQRSIEPGSILLLLAGGMLILGLMLRHEQVQMGLEKTRNEKETHARLAAAIAATGEAIFITDAAGIIEYVNPAFERITGYAAEEAVGRHMSFLENGEKTERISKLIETITSGNTWNSGNSVNKRKDGAEYRAEDTISPVRDESGNIMNYVGLKRDITEKIRLESIAESVNVMHNIGYIFSGIRHELGNPVNSMKVSLRVLGSKLGQYCDTTVEKYVERSLTELSKIEYLLKTLKSFNAYETLDSREVKLDFFMDSFLELMRDDFGQKGIEIESCLDPEANSVKADPRALQQALLNVVTNASDSFPAGQADKKIRIETGVADNKNTVSISVTDNGSGIPEEQLKHLFEPFFTTKPQGNGLGLVITKKMISRMDGTISVMSGPREGTSVLITLPRAASAAFPSP